MSRGPLGDEAYREIGKQLPELIDRELPPNVRSLGLPKDSSIPIAGVSLNDAIDALHGARYALHEVLAHTIWYLEKKTPPSPGNAAFFGKYYCDDVALRLYSSAEHWANAVADMLELREEVAKERKSSRLLRTNAVLTRTRPTDSITAVVQSVVKADYWIETIVYRNDWVHNKPPMVEGLGIQYNRDDRWKTIGSAQVLTFGGGDAPDYSVDGLLEFLKPSLFLMFDVLRSTKEEYRSIVEEKSEREL